MWGEVDQGLEATVAKRGTACDFRFTGPGQQRSTHAVHAILELASGSGHGAWKTRREREIEREAQGDGKGARGRARGEVGVVSPFAPFSPWFP